MRAGRITFVGKAEAEQRELSVREAAAPAFDYPLEWAEASRRIFGTVRSRETFKRLRSVGASVNGITIKLRTVKRPGGQLVLSSEVERFVREYEAAAAERSTRRTPARAGALEPASGQRTQGGRYALGFVGDVRAVGRKLDVRA